MSNKLGFTKKLNVLVTRPQAPGAKLVAELNALGFNALSQPLFTYQARATEDEFQSYFQQYTPNIIIFVSVAAVEFANSTYPFKYWSKAQVIAVGTATANRLNELGISQVIVPDVHTSEGVLALPFVKNIQDKDILIVRGNGGRELMAEHFASKGATVRYIESYQRKWLALGQQQVNYWRSSNINCIVITSNDLLKSVVQLINSDNNNQDNYWQNTCLWLVASDRIAIQAQALGLKQVICSQGASNKAIINSLHNLERDYDRLEINRINDIGRPRQES